MKKEKYRFFQFTDTKGSEDFCRATDLILARAVFERYYPSVTGTIKEIFMSDYDPNKLQENS